MFSKLEKWLEEEYYIFINIPIKCHIIMLTIGLSLGAVLGVFLRVYLRN
jgi:hypothetical protein